MTSVSSVTQWCVAFARATTAKADRRPPPRLGLLQNTLPSRVEQIRVCGLKAIFEFAPTA